MDYVSTTELTATTLLLCSVACLFLALIVSVIKRLYDEIGTTTTTDADPLDPLSYTL